MNKRECDKVLIPNKEKGIVPCFNCGKDVEYEFAKPRERVYCDECKEIVNNHYHQMCLPQFHFNSYGVRTDKSNLPHNGT